jgi:hypothetical protein
LKKSEQIRIYQENIKYRVSRETYFRPKIYKVLQDMIRSANINPYQELIYLQTQPLTALIMNIYTDAGRVMGGRAYQQVRKQAAAMEKAMMPIGYNEQLVNEIIRYFQEHLLDKVVLPIEETMKGWILKYVIQQQLEGKSIAQIVDEMVKHDFPRNRAEVTARTEVLRAANYGAMQGARKSGFDLKKVWISSQDHRTRRIPRDEYNHLTMNGVTIPMNEAFHVPRKKGGYDILQQPGDPEGDAGNVIQCRCTQAFEVQRDKTGRPIKI